MPGYPMGPGRAAARGNKDCSTKTRIEECELAPRCVLNLLNLDFFDSDHQPFEGSRYNGARICFPDILHRVCGFLISGRVEIQYLSTGQLDRKQVGCRGRRATGWGEISCFVSHLADSVH